MRGQLLALAVAIMVAFACSERPAPRRHYTVETKKPQDPPPASPAKKPVKPKHGAHDHGHGSHPHPHGSHHHHQHPHPHAEGPNGHHHPF